MNRKLMIYNRRSVVFWRWWLGCLIHSCIWTYILIGIQADGCPSSESILPCRCSLRGKEKQIWCTHSNLPQIMDGVKAVENNMRTRIDELVLENNQLPALPGRFFATLQIMRLMLRYNSIERVSNGWIKGLENHLVEIYIVEPQLRSIPGESLNGMLNMLAVTIQSDELKHLPNFSGLQNLTYLNIQTKSLNELQPNCFKHLPKLETIHITGSGNLNRLEAHLFDNLLSLQSMDLSRNGINWIHLRALSRLPKLTALKLSYNQIGDIGMIGRIIKDLENLRKLRLDHNIITIVEEASFVDLPHLTELYLNDNHITELQYGAFLRTDMLRTIYLHNNHIKKIHPESFLQASGSGIDTMYIYNNEIEQVAVLRSLLEALPSLKYLDISNNYLRNIEFGSLRGHGTLEQLYLNNNQLKEIERDALMAMPALRELRLSNNSLSNQLTKPFWNLPNLKGLDLSLNNIKVLDKQLLAGLPSLRRLDLSRNDLNHMDADAFIHNPMLETLNVSFNELVSIHPATFRNLNRLFEVDASFNKLMEFMPGVPKIIERILLRGNLIRSLPNDKILSLPNLRMLDLSMNQCEYLPKYGFQGLQQLRVLSLANNMLRKLIDTNFMGIEHLELLHLQENELTQLDDRVLQPLAQLRHLNLRSNLLQTVSDDLLVNNSKLEDLDLSHNNLQSISAAAFKMQNHLHNLDLSYNYLSNISMGLSYLSNLHNIDMSFNQITQLPSEILSTWYRINEFRLSNNLIKDLKQGTFRNLLQLKYLDLSSNEIVMVENAALKNLPELQEFVLADNKLLELKDHAFEDLPKLLAAHFQYNNLRYIAEESFFNAPSLIFLNLSNNHFHNMEKMGLHNMRNLEVLDLSANLIKIISAMPLKLLNWLVELKMDNNEICKIHGLPFEIMPRLRVLSMRNNRLQLIREKTFSKLRGNVAIINVDGNPIYCSCEMQWFSVWLQEINYPYPGPKCQDGRLLRTLRIDKKLCQNYATTVTANGNHRNGALFDGGDNDNLLPLFNEHGDIFQRSLTNNEYNGDGECDLYDIAGGDEKPLVAESEYFYDQYIDYAPANEQSMNYEVNQVKQGIRSPNSTYNKTNNKSRPKAKPTSTPTQIQTATQTATPTATATPTPTSKATPPSNFDLNNTILNTKYIQKPITTNQLSSPFTFFGYPIPSLNLGSFFKATQRGRKDRGKITRYSKSYNTTTTATAPATATAATSTTTLTGDINRLHPATHRMSNYNDNTQSKGRYHMNPTINADLEKYFNNKNIHTGTSDSISTIATELQHQNDRNQKFSSDDVVEISSEELISDKISNSQQQPSDLFRTGFKIPTSIEKGGFRPILPIHTTRGFIPIHGPTLTTPTTPAEGLVAYKGIPLEKIYMTTAAATATTTATTPTTTATTITTTTTIATTTGSTTISTTSSTTTPTTSSRWANQILAKAKVSDFNISSTGSAPRYYLSDTATTAKATYSHLPTEASKHRLTNTSLKITATTETALTRRSTTAETILLIPPPEELVEHLKNQLLHFTTPANLHHINYSSKSAGNPLINFPNATTATRITTFNSFSPANTSRPQNAARSTIVKLQTPQTMNQLLPAADEYHQHTTATNLNPHQPAYSAYNPYNLHKSPTRTQSTINAGQKRNDEAIERKDGLDWYYESYKKSRMATTGHQLFTSTFETDTGGFILSHTHSHLMIPPIILLLIYLLC